jgi:hypothetical protein
LKGSLTASSKDVEGYRFAQRANIKIDRWKRRHNKKGGNRGSALW